MVHTEDTESHIRAVLEDAEYWRTKRLEPIMFQLIRKGKLGFYDLFTASPKPRAVPSLARGQPQAGLEERVETLELNLGRYINGIEIAAQIARDSYFIDEQRKDSGVYDDELKFVHRELTAGI